MASLKGWGGLGKLMPVNTKKKDPIFNIPKDTDVVSSSKLLLDTEIKIPYTISDEEAIEALSVRIKEVSQAGAIGYMGLGEMSREILKASNSINEIRQRIEEREKELVTITALVEMNEMIEKMTQFGGVVGFTSVEVDPEVPWDSNVSLTKCYCYPWWVDEEEDDAIVETQDHKSLSEGVKNVFEQWQKEWFQEKENRLNKKVKTKTDERFTAEGANPHIFSPKVKEHPLSLQDATELAKKLSTKPQKDDRQPW